MCFQFNPKTFNNDIALVELTSPVVLSDRVTPVCLPSDVDPPTGSPCLVAGWGSLFEGKGKTLTSGSDTVFVSMSLANVSLKRVKCSHSIISMCTYKRLILV